MRIPAPRHFSSDTACIDNANTPTRIPPGISGSNSDGESFVWDADKARLNERKHGVRFEEAAGVFFDPLFVVVDASRNDEARQAAIGFDGASRLLYVVHIEIEARAIRIISARRATSREEDTYAQ